MTLWLKLGSDTREIKPVFINLDEEPSSCVLSKGMGFARMNFITIWEDDLVTLWLEIEKKAWNDFKGQQYNLEEEPSPAIMAMGIAGVGPHQYMLREDSGFERRFEVMEDGRLGDKVVLARAKAHDKPIYAVPSMTDIEQVPANGYEVVSTFSGCGGSCLGFRMVGFRTLWASEFVPAAREVYELNHPGVPIDPRDIREVTGEDILKKIGRSRGEVDVLEGSPPCASFSSAGAREKGWGKVKPYSQTKQRTDDLFFEFARLVDEIKPRVFIAENVSGLVKGAAKGYFQIILQKLRSCGYRVEARVLDAQWLGVPQTRARVIFVGVRDDLGVEPLHPKPLSYRYSVRDAFPYIETVEYKTHGYTNKVPGVPGREEFDLSEPAPTVVSGESGGRYYQHEITDKERKEVDIGKYAIGAEWEKLKRGEKGKYFNLVKPDIDEPCPTVTQTGGVVGAASVVHPIEKRKFFIWELLRICGFPDDFQLTGTFRQKWERLGRAVPPVMMSHVARSVVTILDEAKSR